MARTLDTPVKPAAASSLLFSLSGNGLILESLSFELEAICLLCNPATNVDWAPFMHHNLVVLVIPNQIQSLPSVRESDTAAETTQAAQPGPAPRPAEHIKHLQLSLNARKMVHLSNKLIYESNS